MGKVGKSFYRKGTGTYSVKVDNKIKTLYRGEQNKENESKAALEYAKLLIAENAIASEDKTKQLASTVFAAYIDLAKPNPVTTNWKCKVARLLTFSEYIGDLEIGEIKSEDIDNWIVSHPSWSSSTQNCAKKQLQSVFRHKMLRKILPTSPVDLCDKYQDEVRGEDVAISPATYLTLRTAASGMMGEIIDCLWATGARPSEILGASVDEYSPEHRALTKIKHKTTHKGKSRQIMLADSVADILERRINGRRTGYIFPGKRGNPWNHNFFLKKLQKLARKNNIQEKVIAYGFRHGAACHWLKNDISVEQVSAWLGHSNIQVTQRHYAKLIYLLKPSRAKLSSLYPPILPLHEPHQVSSAEQSA